MKRMPSTFHRFLLIAVSCGSGCYAWTGTANVSDSFRSYGLVPNIITKAPAALLCVKFSSGANVVLGKEMSMPEVALVPSVLWDASEDGLYTVMMIDPDAPTPADPFLRSFLHWLVINVEDDVTFGDTVAAFVYPNPPPIGLHRYVLLVYRQAKRMPVKDFVGFATEDRFEFSPEDFADHFNLGDPIAGTFFQTQTFNIKSESL